MKTTEEASAASGEEEQGTQGQQLTESQQDEVQQKQEKEKPSTSLADEIKNLQLSALSTLHRRNDELQEENRQLREANANTVSKIEKPADMAAFLENPEERVAAIVDRALKKQLAPLESFVGEFRAGSAYEKLKNQYRKNPKLGQVIDNYEEHIDRVMQGVEPTSENLQASILNVLGAVTAGFIPEATTGKRGVIIDNTVENKQETPFIPSTPPNAPRRITKPKTPEEQMTEEEITLAKKYGMSNKEYVHLRDADPNDVNSWVMPKEEKK